MTLEVEEMKGGEVQGVKPAAGLRMSMEEPSPALPALVTAFLRCWLSFVAKLWSRGFRLTEA